MEQNYEYHLPVLLSEAISYLITDKNGIYVDGTLGGGGHSQKILEALSDDGKLISFDKDIDAINHCSIKLAKYMAPSVHKFVLRNESFSKACSVAEEWGLINGFLLDLGVSSKHFDNESGGFSYRTNSHLDMRFFPEGKTAEELINSATEEELERIFRIYGEEKFSRKIARRIYSVRRGKALQTTYDLRDAVISALPAINPYDTLSRVFQAIRIVINNELSELETAIKNIIPALAIGGRIVVISYHSLEDRIVKNLFKEHSEPKQHINKYKLVKNATNSVPSLKILTKNPIIPLKNEQETNSRARSAKMRVAERSV